VTTASITEDAGENDRQITWMEEDEVQVYLRFKSNRDRGVIWQVPKIEHFNNNAK
jgi:hypothetical protein